MADVASKNRRTTPATTSSRATYHHDALVRHNRAMETGEVPIVEAPEFHDDCLFRSAWDVSPYNKNRHNEEMTGSSSSHGKRSRTTICARDDIIREAMCFQPVSGYCGMATVNTVLNSLLPPYYVPYPGQGRGYSMIALGEYLVRNCVPDQFIDVEAIFMEPSTTLDQFRSILHRYANNPQFRLLANFHRTPLFYSERNSCTEKDAHNRAYAGHWSPVGGLIRRTKEDDGGHEEFVLVLDTNETYGPFMVTVERFFRAVKTETLSDGYRGFLKVQIAQSQPER